MYIPRKTVSDVTAQELPFTWTCTFLGSKTQVQNVQTSLYNDLFLQGKQSFIFVWLLIDKSSKVTFGGKTKTAN